MKRHAVFLLYLGVLSILFAQTASASSTPEPLKTVRSSGTMSYPDAATLLFYTDFNDIYETNNRLSLPFTHRMNNKGGQWDLVSDDTATGNKSVWYYLPEASERVEFNCYLYGSYQEIRASQEICVVVRTKFPSDRSIGSRGWHEFFVIASEYVDMQTYFSWWGLLENSRSLIFRMKHGYPGQPPDTPWSRQIPSPIVGGEWFELKVYMKRHTSDGVVKVWLNGNLIFDISGVQTKGTQDSFYTQIHKVYGDEVYPQNEAWLDTLAIYDGLP